MLLSVEARSEDCLRSLQWVDSFGRQEAEGSAGAGQCPRDFQCPGHCPGHVHGRPVQDYIYILYILYSIYE